MKTKRIFLGLASMIMAFALMFSACTKSGLNENGAVAVFLTDGPGDFDAVNIDIQKVEVKIDNDSLYKNDDDRCKNDDDRDDDQKRKDDYILKMRKLDDDMKKHKDQMDSKKVDQSIARIKKKTTN